MVAARRAMPPLRRHAFAFHAYCRFERRRVSVIFFFFFFSRCFADATILLC